MRSWLMILSRGFCVLALIVPVRAASSDEIEKWFAAECSAEASFRDTVRHKKDEKLSEDDPNRIANQAKVCAYEGYLASEAFKTSRIEKKIDLMMDACVRTQAAMWASIGDGNDPSSVSDIANRLCESEVADAFGTFKTH
jgi:hypothetical protein